MGSTPPKPVNSILDAIGNTPVVRLNNVVPKDAAEVFVKLEFFNPTGSYKDRMARSMIEEAEKRGDLKAGMTIVEATGGSTGASLAFVSAAKGYQFLVVSSDAFSVEKLRTMSSLGAQLDIVSSPTGKVTADLIPSMVLRAEELSKAEGHYYTNQFHNPDALIGYGKIGQELVEQLSDGIDAFCGAVGTAGMVTGVARALRSKHPSAKIVVLEPAESPIITKGEKGSHGVEGIGSGFVPPHLDRALYDEARTIPEREAREMCRHLAKEEGLLVGTSTGVNIVGAIQLAKELGPGKRVVTVAVDTGLKYLNGTLYADN
ncbi:hypothetical protein ACHAQJ_001308 [Trichoderma viride]